MHLQTKEQAWRCVSSAPPRLAVQFDARKPAHFLANADATDANAERATEPKRKKNRGTLPETDE